MVAAKDKPSEPPSRQKSDVGLVLIGKNSRGQWVAQHQGGLFGGLFVDCKKAMRFVRDEIGDRFHAIVIVSDVLELDMDRKPVAESQRGLALARVA